MCGHALSLLMTIQTRHSWFLTIPGLPIIIQAVQPWPAAGLLFWVWTVVNRFVWRSGVPWRRVPVELSSGVSVMSVVCRAPYVFRHRRHGMGLSLDRHSDQTGFIIIINNNSMMKTFNFIHFHFHSFNNFIIIYYSFIWFIHLVSSAVWPFSGDDVWRGSEIYKRLLLWQPLPFSASSKLSSPAILQSRFVPFILTFHCWPFPLCISQALFVAVCALACTLFVGILSSPSICGLLSWPSGHLCMSSHGTHCATCSLLLQQQAARPLYVLWTFSFHALLLSLQQVKWAVRQPSHEAWRQLEVMMMELGVGRWWPPCLMLSLFPYSVQICLSLGSLLCHASLVSCLSQAMVSSMCCLPATLPHLSSWAGGSYGMHMACFADCVCTHLL